MTWAQAFSWKAAASAMIFSTSAFIFISFLGLICEKYRNNGLVAVTVSAR
jgi:hypothetical protein